MTTKVAVLGLAVVDLVFHIDSIPTIPEKFRANSAEMIGGGGGANAAVAIARLSGAPVLYGRLGEDMLADIITDDLRAENVDVENLKRMRGAQSAFSSIYVDAAGERQIVNFRGAGMVSDASWVKLDEDIAAVLVDNRWSEGTAELLRQAHHRGIPAVVDAEAPVQVEELQVATHVAFSEQGLRSLESDPDLKTALLRATDKLGCWVCVTKGADGVYFLDQGELQQIPAFSTQVVDTLGAGDIWHAAFTLQLAQAVPVEAAIKFANAAAAIKCRFTGGRAGAPSLDEVRQFMAASSRG
jgi:sulfofructose kinase